MMQELTNKNVNHKVDALYKSWLKIKFEERELYDKNVNDTTIKRIKEPLHD